MGITRKIAVPAYSVLLLAAASSTMLIASATSASASANPAYTCDAVQPSETPPGSFAGEGNCTADSGLPGRGPVSGAFDINTRIPGGLSVSCNAVSPMSGFAGQPDWVDGFQCAPMNG